MTEPTNTTASETADSIQDASQETSVAATAESTTEQALATQAAAQPRQNPFKLLAGVFRDLRKSIEEPGAKRPPRWVRIARARHALPRRAQALDKAPDKALDTTPRNAGEAPKKAAGKSPEEFMSDGIGALLGGFIGALSFIAELVLDLQEILIQVDAGKALIEISSDLVKAVTSDEFTSGVESLTSFKPPLGAVKPLLNTLDELVAKAPEKEDLDCISHELFLLLRVAYLEGALDLDRTGKIRLLQWAYGRKYTVRGLGFNEEVNCEIERIGARRLDSQRLGEGGGSETVSAAYGGETIIDLDFKDGPDIAELHQLLVALGYLEAAEAKPPLEKMLAALKNFQGTNGIETSGIVDDATLNRLLNLDSGRELLCRALPFGAKPKPKPEPAVEAKPAESESKPAPAESKPAPAEPKPANESSPNNADQGDEPKQAEDGNAPEKNAESA